MVLYRAVSAKVVGATSSEGYLVWHTTELHSGNTMNTRLTVGTHLAAGKFECLLSKPVLKLTLLLYAISGSCYCRFLPCCPVYGIRRGGFRHVQHVRPNRVPHKKGTPQEDRQIFATKQHSDVG